MLGKKKYFVNDAERPAQSAEDEQLERESEQPGWIRKYLDLADLLIRRRKYKDGGDRPKAA